MWTSYYEDKYEEYIKPKEFAWSDKEGGIWNILLSGWVLSRKRLWADRFERLKIETARVQKKNGFNLQTFITVCNEIEKTTLFVWSSEVATEN